MENNTPNLVFVDIDGTLVSPPTVWHFLRFCVQANIVSRLSLVRACHHFILNKMNRFNQAQALEHWLGLLVGISEDNFISYCQQTFEQRIRSRFIPTMLAKIDYHKKRGDHVVLLSSTLHHFARMIAELLELEGFYSLEIIVENNKLTYKTVVPIPYHQGKVYYAKQHAHKLRMNLDKAFFYTDNISDLPLLKAVGHPIVVNPDFHLQKIARQCDWPILRDKHRIDVHDY